MMFFFDDEEAIIRWLKEHEEEKRRQSLPFIGPAPLKGYYDDSVINPWPASPESRKSPPLAPDVPDNQAKPAEVVPTPPHTTEEKTRQLLPFIGPASPWPASRDSRKSPPLVPDVPDNQAKAIIRWLKEHEEEKARQSLPLIGVAPLAEYDNLLINPWTIRQGFRKFFHFTPDVPDDQAKPAEAVPTPTHTMRVFQGADLVGETRYTHDPATGHWSGSSVSYQPQLGGLTDMWQYWKQREDRDNQLALDRERRHILDMPAELERRRQEAAADFATKLAEANNKARMREAVFTALFNQRVNASAADRELVRSLLPIAREKLSSSRPEDVAQGRRMLTEIQRQSTGGGQLDLADLFRQFNIEPPVSLAEATPAIPPPQTSALPEPGQVPRVSWPAPNQPRRDTAVADGLVGGMVNEADNAIARLLRNAPGIPEVIDIARQATAGGALDANSTRLAAQELMNRGLTLEDIEAYRRKFGKLRFMQGADLGNGLKFMEPSTYWAAGGYANNPSHLDRAGRFIFDAPSTIINTLLPTETPGLGSLASGVVNLFTTEQRTPYTANDLRRLRELTAIVEQIKAMRK